MKSKKSLLVITLVIIVLLATVYSMRLKGQIFGPGPGEPSGPGTTSFPCNPEATPPRFCPEGSFCLQSFGSGPGQCTPCNGAEWCNHCGYRDGRDKDATTCVWPDYSCEYFHGLTRPDGSEILKCRRRYEKELNPEELLVPEKDGECSIRIFPYNFCPAGERCKNSTLSKTGKCEKCTEKRNEWCNVCKKDDDCLSDYVCNRGKISAPTVSPQPESDFIENGKYKQCNRTKEGNGRECMTDSDCDGHYSTFCTDPLDQEYCYTEFGVKNCFKPGTCVQAKKSCVRENPEDILSLFSGGYCNYLEPRAVSECTCRI